MKEYNSGIKRTVTKIQTMRTKRFDMMNKKPAAASGDEEGHLGDALLKKNKVEGEDVEEEDNDNLDALEEEEMEPDMLYAGEKLINVFKEQEKAESQESALSKASVIITKPLELIRMLTVPCSSEDDWDKTRMVVTPLTYCFAFAFLAGIIGGRLTIYEGATNFEADKAEIKQSESTIILVLLILLAPGALLSLYFLKTLDPKKPT